MASSSIGSGALILAVDSQQLSSGLAQSKQQIAGFGASFNGLTAVGSGAFGGIIAGAHTAVSEIEKSFERAHEAVKGAAEFGLTTNTYGALAASARIAGIDVEKFNKGLLKLQEKLNELRGNAPEAAKAIFESLGLSAKDMDVDVNKATELLARGLQKTGNKQALFDLVGPKQFADMMLYLSQGEAGLKKFKDALTGTGEGAEAIEKAAQNMRLFQEQVNRGVDLIVNKLIPGMNKLGDAFNDLSKPNNQKSDLSRMLGIMFPALETASLLLNKPVKQKYYRRSSQSTRRAKATGPRIKHD